MAEEDGASQLSETDRGATSTSAYVEENTSYFTKLKCLIDDDVYSSLHRNILMEGRGRRPHLPNVSLTRRLLLQLYTLKIEGNRTYGELKTWLQSLAPTTASVTESRISKEIVSTVDACTKLSEEETGPFLETAVDFHMLPAPLAALGINRLHLTDVEVYTHKPSEDITNEVVISLDQFRAKENASAIFVRKWIKTLSLAAANLTDSQIRLRVQKTLKRYTVLSKLKNKDPQAFYDFLVMSFMENSTASATTINTSESVTCTNCQKLKCMLKEKEQNIIILKNENESLKSVMENLKCQIAIHSEEVVSLRKQIHDKETVEKAFKECSKKLNQEKDENCKLMGEIESLKKSKMYKNNFLYKQELSQARTMNDILHKEIEDGSAKNKQLAKYVSNLKNKVKLEQSLKSKYKSSWNEQKVINSELKTMMETEEEERVIKLRDEGSSHRYLDNVRQTFYTLQGEANVAAGNCAKVVETVAKYLFNQDLSGKLPSASTSFTFANEAHIIANQQVAEEILNSQHFIYACDGTSRQKVHYLEKHIILSNKKHLFLGFSEIASDDSKTLLEQCVGIFKDLCEIYFLDEGSPNEEQFLKDIMKKLKALLSDRAAVNKAFDAKMAELKHNIVGEEDSSLHFLFCNAHFLLALSSAAEQGVCEAQGGDVLGRDSKPAFLRFSAAKECAALRLIRTTAEVLGPRGDEKSGCREEWVAFCSTKSKKAMFTSYRSNRFNNLFQNASALLHHRHDIEQFLNDYASHSNLKLQSILADLQDSTILSLIGVLSFFHVHLTDPYWGLMNSDRTYADFPKYVQKMKAVLTSWTTKVEFGESVDFIFSDFPVSEFDSSVLAEFMRSDSCHLSVLTTCLNNVALKCKVVLDRQLADFLEDGVFGGELEDKVKAVLTTCPLTNLTGERLFGDFDFSLNKRRNASLHLRSASVMWKHNKTARWLGKKTKSARRKLIKKAITHGPRWAIKKKAEVMEVKAKIKAKIALNKQKKDEKEIKKNERKLAVLNSIIAEGASIVTNKEQLDYLYSQANALQKLKNQIRYRNLVRGEKIVLSGSKKMLYNRILRHISGSNSTDTTE